MSTNPFSLWADFFAAGAKSVGNSMRATETMMASSRVIRDRLPILADACREPATADLPELARMVREKREAFALAGAAAAADLARLQGDVAAHWDEMIRTAGGLALTPAGMGAIAERQVRMMASAAAAVEKSLAPYHSRAGSNARRLARRKRR